MSILAGAKEYHDSGGAAGGAIITVLILLCFGPKKRK